MRTRVLSDSRSFIVPDWVRDTRPCTQIYTALLLIMRARFENKLFCYLALQLFKVMW